MKEEIKFYKPKMLMAGILLFGISLFALGFIVGGEHHIENVWMVILPILGFFIGEGFLCEAASHKVRVPKQNQKRGKSE